MRVLVIAGLLLVVLTLALLSATILDSAIGAWVAFGTLLAYIVVRSLEILPGGDGDFDGG